MFIELLRMSNYDTALDMLLYEIVRMNRKMCSTH